MDAVNDLAAIRARLPYFDRRALSQAWFSAFHLAVEATPAGPKRVFAVAEPASDGPLRASRGRKLFARERAAAAASTASRRIQSAAAGIPSRPGTLRRTVRAAQPLAAARQYPPVRANFTLTIEGARVQILLRRDGPALHVVALCTRRHVELVRRALACADLALRAQGTYLRSSLRALESE